MVIHLDKVHYRPSFGQISLTWSVYIGLALWPGRLQWARSLMSACYIEHLNSQLYSQNKAKYHCWTVSLRATVYVGTLGRKLTNRISTSRLIEKVRSSMINTSVKCISLVRTVNNVQSIYTFGKIKHIFLTRFWCTILFFNLSYANRPRLFLGLYFKCNKKLLQLPSSFIHSFDIP